MNVDISEYAQGILEDYFGLEEVQEPNLLTPVPETFTFT